MFQDRGRARMCDTGMPKVPVLHAGQNFFWGQGGGGWGR